MFKEPRSKELPGEQCLHGGHVTLLVERNGGVSKNAAAESQTLTQSNH